MYKIALKINGMACTMCESHVNDCVRRSFEISKIKSSHSKGESVIICENPLDEEKLKKVISDIGYTLISVSCEPYEKKGLFSR